MSFPTQVCSDPNCSEHGCVFCRIITGKEQARIVGETDHALAFLPMKMATRGHTLVIPKRHVADLLEASWVDLSDTMWLVKDVARRVQENLPDVQGLNLIQSTGEVATLTVFHIHFHIVPRGQDDNFGRLWPESTRYSQDEFDRIAAEIRGEKVPV